MTHIRRSSAECYISEPFLHIAVIDAAIGLVEEEEPESRNLAEHMDI